MHNRFYFFNTVYKKWSYLNNASISVQGCSCKGSQHEIVHCKTTVFIVSKKCIDCCSKRHGTQPNTYSKQAVPWACSLILMNSQRPQHRADGPLSRHSQICQLLISCVSCLGNVDHTLSDWVLNRFFAYSLLR